MRPRSSRRSFLAALGAGTAGIVTAGYTGTVTVPRLSPLWERWRVGSDGGSGITGRATAVAEGRLLLTTDGSLAALDPGSGERLWDEWIPDGRPLFGVTTDDDTVYAGDDALVAARFDGTERWRVRLEGDDGPFRRQLACPPVVDGDRLYLGTSYSRLAALDTADGSVAWSVPLDGWNAEALATMGDALFVGLGRYDRNHGFVRAVDRRDGSALWEVTVSDRRIDFAVGDSLYCAVGRRGGIGGVGVIAFDPADGRRHWTYDLVQVNAVTLREGTIYAVSGTGDHDDVLGEVPPEGALVALDAGSGEELWKTPAKSYGRVAPEVTDDRIYVGSGVTGGPRRLGEGAVLAYTSDGDHLWTHPMGEGNQPAAPPVFHDGTLYVGGDDAIVAIEERGW